MNLFFLLRRPRQNRATLWVSLLFAYGTSALPTSAQNASGQIGSTSPVPKRTRAKPAPGASKPATPAVNTPADAGNVAVAPASPTKTAASRPTLSPALQATQKALNERRHALLSQQNKLDAERKKLSADQEAFNLGSGLASPSPTPSPTPATTTSSGVVPTTTPQATPASNAALLFFVGLAGTALGFAVAMWLASREKTDANKKPKTGQIPPATSGTSSPAGVTGEEILRRVMDVARIAGPMNSPENGARKGKRQDIAPLQQALSALEEAMLARRGLQDAARMQGDELRDAVRVYRTANETYRRHQGPSARPDAEQTARWLDSLPSELETIRGQLKRANERLERATTQVKEREGDIETLVRELERVQNQLTRQERELSLKHEEQFARLKSEAHGRLGALKNELEATTRREQDKEREFQKQTETAIAQIKVEYEARTRPLQRQNEAFATISEQQTELEKQTIRALRDLQSSSEDIALVAAVGFLMEHSLSLLGRCVYLDSQEMHQLAMTGLHSIASSFEGSLSSFAVLRKLVEQLDPGVVGREWQQATGHDQQSLFAGIVTTIRQRQRAYGQFPRTFSFALANSPEAARGTAYTAVGD